jgi:hypothetical protein
MISGHGLFLLDQREGTGPGTAVFYKRNSARLLLGFRRASLPAGFDDSQLVHDPDEYVSSPAQTFEGSSVTGSCLRRAELMVTTLLRSLPPTSIGAAAAADAG